jgi:hypothetical protein
MDDCTPDAIYLEMQATDLASLLAHASPGRCYEFALSMHERACEQGDAEWCALWAHAVTVLRQNPDAVESSFALACAS